MPPCCAIAIASDASVTVSIAAEQSGICRRMPRHQKHVVEGKPFGNLLSYHGFLEFTPLDNSSRNSFVSVPRAVATGPGYAVVPTACVASVLRLSSRND